MAFFGLFGKAAAKRARRPEAFRARPALEALESRVVPYATSGNAWPSPQLVTLSFMPDGTVISAGSNGTVTSDLYATLGAKFSTAAWQDAILTAAQTWAQQANINFSVVADNGTPSGQGAFQQGDPGMGDIRVGAYSLGSNYLGGTYMPPAANNYSIAGDMNLNDTINWNLGTTYDLQTVALHEVGHALGMAHSTTYGAVMWPSYGGVKRKLTQDDVNGIQAIYGARQPDAYATQSSGNLLSNVVGTVTNLLGGLLGGPTQNPNDMNNSFQSATNLSSLINPTTLVAQAPNLNIISTSDVHYFGFIAPTSTAGTVTFNVQSAGLSLLRPAVTVYAGDQATVLGAAAGTSSDFNGDNLTVTVNGVTAGQVFYVKVTGADTTAFGTGAYGLTADFGTGPAPAVTPPNTQLLNGAVLQGGGAQPLVAQPMDDMYIDDAHITDADFLRELAALNASHAENPAPEAVAATAPAAAAGPEASAATPAHAPAGVPAAQPVVVPGVALPFAHLALPGLPAGTNAVTLAADRGAPVHPSAADVVVVHGPAAFGADGGAGDAARTAGTAAQGWEATLPDVPADALPGDPAAGQVPSGVPSWPQVTESLFARQEVGPDGPAVAPAAVPATAAEDGTSGLTRAPLAVLAGALAGSWAVPREQREQRERRRPSSPPGR